MRKKTYEEYLEMIKRGSVFYLSTQLLYYVPEEMQTDELIDIAMKDIRAFEHIKDEKKKTYSRCLRAVKRNWKMLEFVPDQMQTDEIIDAAMYDDPLAFEHIKDEKKKTYDRCLNAVKYRSVLMLKYVPEELKERVKKEVING